MAFVLLPGFILADSKEYAVKAAFIYNFAKFITWPEQADDEKSHPFVVGIYGEDHFENNWDDIASKTIAGKSVEIRKCGYDLHLAAACQILFIDPKDEAIIEDVLLALSGKPVLTVGDTPLFAEKGGMIGLYENKNKIRFSINLDSCKKGGLVPSSGLLKLATIIQSEKNKSIE